MHLFGMDDDNAFHVSAARDWFSVAPRDQRIESQLFGAQLSGINFDKYEDIPVETSGNECPQGIDTVCIRMDRPFPLAPSSNHSPDDGPWGDWCIVSVICVWGRFVVVLTQTPLSHYLAKIFILIRQFQHPCSSRRLACRRSFLRT
jgi:hypothetical protein